MGAESTAKARRERTSKQERKTKIVYVIEPDPAVHAARVEAILQIFRTALQQEANNNPVDS
jgi:hypothetical protein